MSARRAVALGLRRARPALRLVLVAWAANLGLALLLALPAWAGLNATLANAPEGDLLLEQLRLGLLFELLHGHPAALELWFLLLVGLALVAVGLNLLMAAGLLEALKRPEGPLLGTFGCGALRYFRRSLRLALLAALGFSACAAFVLMLAAPLRRRFADSAWEPMPLVLGASTVLALGFVALVWLLAFDLARARVVAQDLTRVRPALGASLRQVLKSYAPLAVWAASALLYLALLGAYAAFRNAVPAVTWPAIVSMLVAQQALLLGRAGLRLGLWGAFFELQAVGAVDPAASSSSRG